MHQYPFFLEFYSFCGVVLVARVANQHTTSYMAQSAFNPSVFFFALFLLLCPPPLSIPSLLPLGFLCLALLTPKSPFNILLLGSPR